MLRAQRLVKVEIVVARMVEGMTGWTLGVRRLSGYILIEIVVLAMFD
jgi:hypothetical protein